MEGSIDFLSGEEEAEAFKAKEFVKLQVNHVESLLVSKHVLENLPEGRNSKKQLERAGPSCRGVRLQKYSDWSLFCTRRTARLRAYENFAPPPTQENAAKQIGIGINNLLTLTLDCILLSLPPGRRRQAQVNRALRL